MAQSTRSSYLALPRGRRGAACRCCRPSAPKPCSTPVETPRCRCARPHGRSLAVVVVECALRNATHRGGISANSVLRGSHPDSSELSVSTVGLQMQKRNEKKKAFHVKSHTAHAPANTMWATSVGNDEDATRRRYGPNGPAAKISKPAVLQGKGCVNLLAQHR